MRALLVVVAAAASLSAQKLPGDRIIECDGVLSSVRFSSDGASLAGIGQDGQVRLWDLRTGTLKRTLPLEKGDTSVTMPVQSDLLGAVSTDGAIKFWDLRTADPARRMVQAKPEGRGLTVSRDGKLIAGSGRAKPNGSEYTVRVWDASSGTERFAAPAGLGGIAALALSPDGGILVASSYDTDLRAWSTRDGELLRVIDELPVTMFSVAFSPDGKYLATAGADRTVYLWDTKTWKLARKLSGQPEMISAIAFSPDSRLLLTGGFSEFTVRNPVKILLWDVAGGTVVRSMQSAHMVGSVAFSPDGKLAASANFDKYANIWEFPPANVMRSRNMWVVATLLFAVQAAAFEGDAYRGAALLEQNKCTQCHSIRGQGGKTAPDLGTRTSRQFSPALLASVMWNHAPKMWSAMAARGMERPKFTDHNAEDLFAYFYSVRFFERPGDAERGKRLFVENHCAGCHALSGRSTGPGKPIRDWTAANDPIVLVQAMWNHSALMKQALASKQFKWITLSAQDLADFSVYIQKLPDAKPNRVDFWLPGPQTGEALFRDKGCAGCHQGGLSPEREMSNQTLTGVAADMWNHAPRMEQAPFISVDEMRQIVAYVWEKQYLGANGDAARGQQVFEKKNCVACHNDSNPSAPHLSGGERVYSPVTMISVLWQHGPAMLEQMGKKQIPWPVFTPAELLDLTSYLNSRP